MLRRQPKDWKSLPEGREKYQAYLCSRQWAEKRNAVLARANGLCERCGGFLGKYPNVHHQTYARQYAEALDDLIGICLSCHEFIHGKTDVDPKAVRDMDEAREQLRQHAIADRLANDPLMQRLESGEAVGRDGVEVLRAIINRERKRHGIVGYHSPSKYDYLWMSGN